MLEMNIQDVVESYQLPLNSFSIKVNFVEGHSASNRQIIVNNPNRSAKVRIIGDGYFTDSTLTSNLGKEISYTADLQYLYISNGTSEVIFESKNTMITFSVGSYTLYGTKALCNGDLKFMPRLQYFYCMNFQNKDGSYFSIDDVDTSAISKLEGINNVSVTRVKCIEGNIENIKNINNIRVFRMSGQMLTGNINALYNNTSITELDISYNMLHGNIVELGSFTNATLIGIQGNLNIYGNLEEYLTKLYENGKNSGTVEVRAYDSKVKYNNNYIQNGTIFHVVFTATGWTIE